MKKILFLLLLCGSLISQNDTIFKKGETDIPCTITGLNNHTIFYLDQYQVGRFLARREVDAISRNGKRTLISAVKPITQRVDSVNVSDELFHIRTNMMKFHSQYTTGVGIVLVGGALTASSFLLKDGDRIRDITGLGGLVLTVIGAATCIDAHKYFGRAGWGVSGKGNMVAVRYRFK